jgi:LysM repeat protein
LKRDDRLSSIAGKYGISLLELKHINDISSRRKIGPGTTVLVPAKATDATVDLPDLPAPPAPVFRRTHHHASHHKGGVKTASAKKSNHKSTSGKKSAAASNVRNQVLLVDRASTSR